VIKVNNRGQIIADFGLQWYRYKGDKNWWSPGTPYRIDQVGKLFKLYLKSQKDYIADTLIFTGYAYRECMRVAEIYQVRRRN